MDLTYPDEAEEFRTEIRAWLEENLPDGWFDDGFEMTDLELGARGEHVGHGAAGRDRVQAL